MKDNKIDVVVIGAGMGGLTAAALLSLAGLSVKVIEEQKAPGGYLVAFTRKQFIFDSSVQWLNGCCDGGFLSSIFSIIGDGYPRCVAMKRIRRYRGESFDYLLTNQPDDFRKTLLGDFPEEKAGINRFFDDCRKNGERFLRLNKRMRGLETMTPFEKIKFGFQMFYWIIPVWKYLHMSAVDGLNRYFKYEDIKKVFCSEETFMAIMMPICWAYTGDFQALPTGGVDAFSRWLVGKIKLHGSTVILGNRVQSIIVENNAAVGVVTANGETIRCEYVVAACDAVTLYQGMLGYDQSVPILKKLLAADLYYSMFTLYLGLNCPAEDLGIYEEPACITKEGLSRQEHFNGDPVTSCLIVCAPSVNDKTRAPEGHSTVVVHCAVWMKQETEWNVHNKKGQEYREVKDRYTKIIIARLNESFGIELEKHIVVTEAATPFTYWRYTRNRDGSVMGQRPTWKNIKSKVAGSMTPVKNCYLAGHWAEYGGGIPIAAKTGANAALMILKKKSPLHFKQLVRAFEGKNQH